MSNKLKEDFIVILNPTKYEDVLTFDAEIETFLGTMTIPKLQVRCDLGKGIPCEGHLGYKLIYPDSIKLNKQYEVNIVNKLIHSGYLKHPLDGKVELNLEWRSSKFKTDPTDRGLTTYKFRDHEGIRGLKEFKKFLNGLGYDLSTNQLTTILSGHITGPVKRKYPDLSPEDFQRISKRCNK